MKFGDVGRMKSLSRDCRNTKRLGTTNKVKGTKKSKR